MFIRLAFIIVHRVRRVRHARLVRHVHLTRHVHLACLVRHVHLVRRVRHVRLARLVCHVRIIRHVRHVRRVRLIFLTRHVHRSCLVRCVHFLHHIYYLIWTPLYTAERLYEKILNRIDCGQILVGTEISPDWKTHFKKMKSNLVCTFGLKMHGLILPFRALWERGKDCIVMKYSPGAFFTFPGGLFGYSFNNLNAPRKKCVSYSCDLCVTCEFPHERIEKRCPGSDLLTSRSQGDFSRFDYT